jgi:DNA gyrase inhibitor GyrI
MDQQDVRIVTLPPMRVACINAYCKEPENEAFTRMHAWARAHDLLEKPYRTFGFDNPTSTAGSPNRGYDVWITVDESIRADGEAAIIDFPGGLYAVMRVDVTSPWDDIPSAWQRLIQWRAASRYREASHQWLEEHIGPLDQMGGDKPFVLDLHLPIGE